MMKYKYAEKYFDLHSRIGIWKKLNCNEDIKKVISSANGLITYLNNYYPENQDRVSIQEKELGKIEIALDQINTFPGIFTFSEEEVISMKEIYKELEKQVEEMNIKSNSSMKVY